MIEQLITRIATQVGLTEDQARQGVGVVLGLLKAQGEAGPVGDLFSQIPGAEALASQYEGSAQAASGGPVGGLMGRLGGMVGGKTGDKLSALAAFQQTGLSAEQGKAMLPVAQSFLTEHASEDTVRRALASVPALKGFVS